MMSWKRRKDNLAHKFPDLEYLPPGKSAWDCSLSSLAYGIRMDIQGVEASLNDWATRHGVSGSGSYERYGDSAMVLWHGTSRERADKIAEHGLFHKRGLWTAPHPRIPHAFCRTRSARFRTEGAVICLVLDRDQLIEGRDYEVENYSNTIRFQHGLPPRVVQYILVRDEIRYVGTERAAQTNPWVKARFKHSAGQWRPICQTPVRFSEDESFSTLNEFVRLCIAKLLHELDGVSPLETLSVLYSLVDPWEALRHDDVIDILGEISSQIRRHGRLKIFMP
jgi:hypothetical protein